MQDSKPFLLLASGYFWMYGRRPTGRTQAGSHTGLTRLAIPSAAALGPLAPADFCPVERFAFYNQKESGYSPNFFLFSLFLDIGQKSHEASTLHRLLDCSLLLCGKTRALSAHDASVRIDELPQEVNVFVVDVLNIVLT